MPESQTPNTIGLRLRSAREALGLDSKEAAAQLRLNEKIILMLEKDAYASDIPPTFIRGYLRSYGKLLQIPDHEIHLAIEPIQMQSVETQIPMVLQELPLTTKNYFMQLFTGLIITTLIGLVVMWWYNHSTPAVLENHIIIPTEKTIPAVASPPLSTTVSMPVNPEVSPVESTSTPLPAVAAPTPKNSTAPIAHEDEDSSADDADNNIESADHTDTEEAD